MANRKQRYSTALTNTVGGILVGLDEQLLRATPRAEVLVQRGKSVRGLSAQGGTLVVGMPGDPIEINATTPAKQAPTDC